MGEKAISIIMSKTKFDHAQAKGVLENMTPQKRLFQPEEVGYFAAMIAAPDAAGINGGLA